MSDTIRRVSVVDAMRGYLSELAVDQRINQKELAKKIGKSQGYVSMILAGKRLGGELRLLAEIADALKTPLSELIAEAERRDLIRHVRDQGSALPPDHQGETDDPASARVRELEHRVEEFEQIVPEIQAMLVRLTNLATGEESRTAPARAPKGRGRRRKAS